MNTAIIVEDEENVRQLLVHYAEKYCGLKILATAENVDKAYLAVLENNPDIVFLDISLPGQNGFELLNKIKPINFEIIFVTAFNEYALQALKISAVDYLLKPVDIAELKEAVFKAQERIKAKKHTQNLEILLENLQQSSQAPRKLAIPDGHGFVYEDIANVIRLKAHGRYTEIFLTQNRKYLVTKNLGEFDEMLAGSNFVRVHHSHLVNPIHIANYDKSNGGFLNMSDGSYIEVSKRKKDNLKNLMGMFLI